MEPRDGRAAPTTEVPTVEISLGAAAFWISLAAVMIASGWFKIRRDQLKHETLLRLIEKTGQLDAEQVKLLFPLPPPPQWPAHLSQPADPEAGWKLVRGFGTVILSVAAGLWILFTILLEFGTALQQENAIVGYGAASIVTCVGLGFFVASRYTGKARGDRDRDRQGR